MLILWLWEKLWPVELCNLDSKFELPIVEAVPYVFEAPLFIRSDLKPLCAVDDVTSTVGESGPIDELCSLAHIVSCSSLYCYLFTGLMRRLAVGLTSFFSSSVAALKLNSPSFCNLIKI